MARAGSDSEMNEQGTGKVQAESCRACVCVCTDTYANKGKRIGKKGFSSSKSHNLCYHWIEKSVISCVCIMNLNLETNFPWVTFLALLLIQQIPRRQNERNRDTEKPEFKSWFG